MFSNYKQTALKLVALVNSCRPGVTLVVSFRREAECYFLVLATDCCR